MRAAADLAGPPKPQPASLLTKAKASYTYIHLPYLCLARLYLPCLYQGRGMKADRKTHISFFTEDFPSKPIKLLQDF